MSVSERLINQLLDIGDSDLPDEVLAAVMSRMIDTFGVALSAAAMGEGVAATRALSRYATTEGATFWGTNGLRGRPSDVALANGSLCHAMDYDDTHTGSVVHPSGFVVPTAVAVGEELGATGRATLAAAALGYEAAIRLGLGAPGAFQHRGFQGSAVLGPFASALVAARLRGSSPETLRNAWGVAGSMASGINEFHADGSQAKQIHLGWAAHNGIMALDLAEAGATGPTTVLEGSAGVFAVFAGAGIDAEAMLSDIGSRYHLLDIAPKPYPACHCIHSVIDAWLELSADLGLAAEDVDTITCLVPEWYVGIILEPSAIRNDPPTAYAARFSLPYCLAKTVVDHDFGLASVRSDNLKDPEVRQMMNKIDYETVEFDEFPAYFPGGVRVKLRNGETHERVVRHNRGSDRSPLSDGELTAKLDQAGRLVGSDSYADLLVPTIRSLVDAPDLSALQRAMAAFEAPQLAASSA